MTDKIDKYLSELGLSALVLSSKKFLSAHILNKYSSHDFPHIYLHIYLDKMFVFQMKCVETNVGPLSCQKWATHRKRTVTAWPDSAAPGNRFSRYTLHFRILVQVMGGRAALATVFWATQQVCSVATGFFGECAYFFTWIINKCLWHFTLPLLMFCKSL